MVPLFLPLVMYGAKMNKKIDSYFSFEIDVNLAKSAKVLTSGVQISVWRDARVKFSFDLEGEANRVPPCSRGRRVEALAARSKRRHSRLSVSISP